MQSFALMAWNTSVTKTDKNPNAYTSFVCLFVLFCLFLAALGLRCCTRAFSSCGEQGLLFVAVHVGFSLWWLLLLQSTGCRHVGFRFCGMRALERRLSICGARA